MESTLLTVEIGSILAYICMTILLLVDHSMMIECYNLEALLSRHEEYL